MNEDLNKGDLDIILDALIQTRNKVGDGENYPSYEDKMQRVKQIEVVLNKVRKLKKDWID